MARAKKAAQVVIYDRPSVITMEQHDAEMGEVLERFATMEHRAEAAEGELRLVRAADDKRIGELLHEVQVLQQHGAVAAEEIQRREEEHRRAQVYIAKLDEQIRLGRESVMELSTQVLEAVGRPAAPPRQWCVRQGQEERGLEAALNALAQEGWQVYAIFEPRGGAYRVIAWKEIAQPEATAYRPWPRGVSRYVVKEQR